MWYENSTWRNLIDMHIPDWKEGFLEELSAEAYVDALAQGNPDTALVYTGNCLGICFWPTKVGHMHKGLKGRDFISDICREVKKRGMKLNLYYNIWSRWAYDTHPAWRMRTVDGYDTCHPHGGSSRFGQVCMNAEPYREYVRAQIRDLCENYPCDGLWIDMIGWHGTVCFCPHCRERFLAETGLELPRIINWRDPTFLAFQRARERWFTEFAQMIRDVAEEARPGLTIAYQSGSWQGGWGGAATQSFFNLNDYLAADFYANPLKYSVICKYVTNVTPNRPMEFMTSRCTDLSDHTTTKTRKELMASARGAYAHNAAFVYIDAIDPSGSVNEKFHADMGRLHREVKPYAEHVSNTARLTSDVALYFNMESGIDLKQCGKDVADAPTHVPIPRHMGQIARTLIDNNIAYDVIGQPQLGNLDRYPVIALCEQYVLSDEEADAFRKYVRNGGHLIATGQTGMIAPLAPRADFALSDVLGVSFDGELFEDVAYMAPTEEGRECFPHSDARYPLFVEQQFIRVKAEKDVKTLATITLPYSRTDEIVKFGSAISNPPERDSGLPAIVERQFGKGKAMYIAAPIELETYESKREVFARLLKRFIERPRVKIEAPAWLEAVVWQDAERNEMTISAFNSIEEASDLVAQNVTVTAQCPGKVKTARLVGGGETVPFVQSGDEVSFKLKEFIDFAMVSVQYDPV